MTTVSQGMNWFAQTSQGGFFEGLRSGAYEKQNLRMSIEQGGPQIANTPLVASGKLMFGMSQADQILLGRDEGIPLVAIFGGFATNPQGLMFHKSNPVTKVEDLNGRKVYVAPTAAYWLYFQKKYKLDQVEQLNYNGQLALFLADQKVVFQCYVSTEPPAARKEGADPGYFLNADTGFNPYANLMFCTEQTIKEKPEVVQAYVTASIAGWRGFADNPDPTIQYIVSDYRKDYDIPLAKQAWEVEKPLLTGGTYDPAKIGLMTEERWRTLHDQLREAGVLKKDVDYKLAFDNRFVEAALKG
jgi:NitT/TauT family transport system substrate-binding protein